MKRNLRFLMISLGGIALMTVIAMAVASLAGIDPSEINETSLAKNWFWYRATGYLLLLLLWPQICRYLTRPRFDIKLLSDEDLKNHEGRREKDITYLKSQWWKVAILFVFFEGIMIQGLGV